MWWTLYRVDLYVFIVQSVSHLWAVGSQTEPETVYETEEQMK